MFERLVNYAIEDTRNSSDPDGLQAWKQWRAHFEQLHDQGLINDISLDRATEVFPGEDPNKPMALLDGSVVYLRPENAVVVNGERRNLTPSQAKLMGLLAAYPNRVLPRQLIEERIWPDGYIADTNLNVLIGNLRQKVEPDPKKPQLIHTQRGIGYMFGEISEDPLK